jgi:hypothetical protein
MQPPTGTQLSLWLTMGGQLCNRLLRTISDCRARRAVGFVNKEVDKDFCKFFPPADIIMQTFQASCMGPAQYALMPPTFIQHNSL